MATAAAAVVAKARRDVVEHFMQADAVSPDGAVPFVPASRIQERMLARWQRAGVIREAGPERWYLHMPSYADAVRRRRRFAAAGILAGLAAVGAALIAH